MPRRKNGFTLIELLVVIAILGIIAVVVALNVTGFIGRGALQAANIELHQAQTAIVSAMSDAGANAFIGTAPYTWSGQDNVLVCIGANGTTFDAADYIYGKFRAAYKINSHGEIFDATCNASGQWGNLHFCDGVWQIESCS